LRPKLRLRQLLRAIVRLQLRQQLRAKLWLQPMRKFVLLSQVLSEKLRFLPLLP
jgi:hypothetical protein